MHPHHETATRLWALPRTYKNDAVLELAPSLDPGLLPEPALKYSNHRNEVRTSVREQVSTSSSLSLDYRLVTDHPLQVARRPESKDRQ